MLSNDDFSLSPLVLAVCATAAGEEDEVVGGLRIDAVDADAKVDSTKEKASNDRATNVGMFGMISETG